MAAAFEEVRLSPIEAEIRAFLEGVVGSDIHLVAIEPTKDGIVEGRHFGDDVDHAVTWAMNKNRANRGVYWTANIVRALLHKKAEEKDITGIRFAYADVDAYKAEDPAQARKSALEKIEATTPSFIIDSGNGLQPLYRLEDQAISQAEAKRLNVQLRDNLGGDAIQNVDRVLRLPGTVNWPNEKNQALGLVPVMAKLIADDIGISHSAEALAASLPASTAKAVAKRERVKLEAVEPQTPASLGIGEDDHLHRLITDPPNRDRSAAVQAVAHEMTRREMGAEIIAGVLTNPENPVAEHVLGQAQPLRAVTRAIGKAVAEEKAVADDFTASPGDPSLKPAALEVDGNGFIQATISNLEHALRSGRFCGVDIARDDFTGLTMFAPHGTGDWQPLTDDDQVNLRLSLERKRFKKIGREDFREIVRLVARELKFDSAKQWLNGLEWDGVERVNNFLPDYFGTERSPYSTAVSRYWLTAHAARVLEPGCQCDMVPILVSPEGRMKSSSLTAMVPSLDHFVEIDLEHKDADLSRKMQGTLIGELAELKGLSGRSAEANKAWVTRRFEEWTPKYVEGTQRVMRRLVLVGTTNETQFLSDRTGERRWLPIVIGNAARERIKADRDQLWAEAREIVKNRIKAELDPVAWEDASELAGEEREQFKKEDTWADGVSRWRKTEEKEGGAAFFTTEEALAGIGLSVTQMTPLNEQRIAKVLRDLGYIYGSRKWIGGQKKRVWTVAGPSEDH